MGVDSHQLNSKSRKIGLRPLLLLGLGAIACGFSASHAWADFSATYVVKEATLVLFNQPQTSPFEQLNCRVQLKGERVRFEATDHWGRQHIWISDRSTGEVWRLFPESRQYQKYSGGWPCDRLADHVAYALNYYLEAARLDSLRIQDDGPGQFADHNTRQVLVSFDVRLFGLPRPVRVSGTVHFPVNEEDAFGAAVTEVYCQHRPETNQWQKSLQLHVPLSDEEAGFLAQVMALPLAFELQTQLGMGHATLVLAAERVSGDKLAPELFTVPGGYVAADAESADR